MFEIINITKKTLLKIYYIRKEKFETTKELTVCLLILRTGFFLLDAL